MSKAAKQLAKPEVQTCNERLRELVKGAGLTQTAALEIFNHDIGVRPLTESAWKGYFCAPGTTRFRNFSSELLEHAEHVFGPLQIA